MNPHFFIWLSGLVIFGLLYRFDQANRKRIGLILLVWVSAFVAQVIILSTGHENRLTGASTGMESDRAELLLRFESALDVIEQKLIAFRGKQPRGAFFVAKRSGTVASAHKDFHEEAGKILEGALSSHQESSLLKAQLAILLYDSAGASCHKEALGLSEDLVSKGSNAGAHRLGRALLSVYSANHAAKLINPMPVPELARVFQSELKPGWYQDTVMLRLYKVSGQSESYRRQRLLVLDKSAHLVCNFLGVLLAGAVAIPIGVLVILCQGGLPAGFFLAMLGATILATLKMVALGAIFTLVGLMVMAARLVKISRSGNAFSLADSEAKVVRWDLWTVYKVLLAWLATQILFGSLAHGFIHSRKLLSSGSLIASITAFVTYLLSNGPGLFYIYWFALRPYGVKFSDGVRLYFHTGSSGLFRLILSGVLTWCAAIPVVMMAFILASKYLGAQGSANPIISLVLETAQSSNQIAIVIFYLTLGFLAPVCEESLFRGFLYRSLRTRFGIGISLLASAALFASIHFDAGALVPLFCLGWMFGLVYERTGSLLPSMIAHGLWNCCTFTLVLLLFTNR